MTKDEENKIERLRIAKEAYKSIVQAITELEEKFDVTFSLPLFVEVEGEKFHMSQLHLFSKLTNE